MAPSLTLIPARIAILVATALTGSAGTVSADAESSWTRQPAAHSAGAMPDDLGIDSEWLDGTTLGLQRGFVLRKAKTKSVGTRVETPKQKQSAATSAAAKSEEPSVDRGWLDGTTLGLQRGFVLRKAKTKSVGARVETPKQKQSAATSAAAKSEEPSVDRGWLDGATLGLQRGFVLHKAAAKNVGAKSKQPGTFADLPHGLAAIQKEQSHTSKLATSVQRMTQTVLKARERSDSLAVNSTRAMLDEEVGIDRELLRGAILGLQRSVVLRRRNASSNVDVAVAASKRMQGPVASPRPALIAALQNSTAQERGNISVFRGAAAAMSSVTV